MIDAAALLRDIKTLYEASGVADGFDATVEKVSNMGRREAMVLALDKLVQRLDAAHRLRALIPFLVGTFLVRSNRNASGTTDLSIVDETHVKSLDSNESWMNKVDSGGTRLTYYGEFSERYHRLHDHIVEGAFDPILGLDPAYILHEISGLKGELLPHIGWDPLHGETYSKLANDPMHQTLDEISQSYESARKSMEATFKAINSQFTAATARSQDSVVDSQPSQEPTPKPRRARVVKRAHAKAKIVKIYSKKDKKDSAEKEP